MHRSWLANIEHLNDWPFKSGSGPIGKIWSRCDWGAGQVTSHKLVVTTAHHQSFEKPVTSGLGLPGLAFYGLSSQTLT
eukprot:scaffold4383_cov61-Cyclotella_meneghiniana.AAC.11